MPPPNLIPDLGAVVAQKLLQDIAHGLVGIQEIVDSRQKASDEQGVHYRVVALMALHQRAEVHLPERLIRKAGLGRWQREAVGNHLRVGARQALGK